MSDLIEPGFFYHVYNRGNNKENIFREERNYKYFLSLVDKHLLPVADIYCYCLLSNHFHILLRIKDDESFLQNHDWKNKLHQPFSNLFNAYTKAVNKSFGREGSLFQKNFHRVRVTNDEYLKTLIAYIHLNPVKHALTEDFKSWHYSSFPAIISEKKTRIKRRETISFFDDRKNFIYWHDFKKIKYEGVIKMIDLMDE